MKRRQPCFYCGEVPKAYECAEHMWNIGHECHDGGIGRVYLACRTLMHLVRAWNAVQDGNSIEECDPSKDTTEKPAT